MSRLAEVLLPWFDLCRRNLPWRADRDPYRIWVSEVMLQQTPVAKVVPYFERFVRAFPSITALAAADEQSVLKLWEGLGYYRRARDLHQAARTLASRFGDTLPADPVVWAELPGVGRYILGAVLSQAFELPLPILEVNSIRVFSRTTGYRGDPRTAAGRKDLWQIAADALPMSRRGDFNQAVMELGALICTPEKPACTTCPAADLCHAKRRNLTAEIPPPSPRRTITPVRAVAIVIRKGELVLLRQRPPEGRWANLWEFPYGELQADETWEAAADRTAKELGVTIELGAELLTVRYGITRFRITMVCLEASWRAGEADPTSSRKARWVRPSELHSLPVSTPQRRLAEAVRAAIRQTDLFSVQEQS